MIAHSLPDPYFGPASEMHGATYIVDAEFFSKTLNAHNVVLDIGYASRVLDEVLATLNYQNLDTLGIFEGQLTTTEYLARHIFDALKSRMYGSFNGSLRVTLGESHVAWASYEESI